MRHSDKLIRRISADDLFQPCLGPILRRIAQHIFGVLNIYEVIQVIRLAEKHIEAQAGRRVYAPLHQLHNVALAAP